MRTSSRTGYLDYGADTKPNPSPNPKPTPNPNPITQTLTVSLTLTLTLALSRREREALQLACPGGEQEQGVEDHAHPAEGPPWLLRAERHHRRGRLIMNEVGASQERAGSRTDDSLTVLADLLFAFPASFMQQGVSSGPSLKGL